MKWAYARFGLEYCYSHDVYIEIPSSLILSQCTPYCQLFLSCIRRTLLQVVESLIGSQTWNIVLNLVHEFVLVSMRGNVLSSLCISTLWRHLYLNRVFTHLEQFSTTSQLWRLPLKYSCCNFKCVTTILWMTTSIGVLVHYWVIWLPVRTVSRTKSLPFYVVRVHIFSHNCIYILKRKWLCNILERNYLEMVTHDEAFLYKVSWRERSCVVGDISYCWYDQVPSSIQSQFLRTTLKF